MKIGKLSMFIERSITLPRDYSFFLFGARGTGKTALLTRIFDESETLYINLLSPQEEFRFIKNPEELRQLVLGSNPKIKYIVIDEIQKVPKLLDVVHLLIETDKSDKRFVLTGSSARKLRSGGANLLAGRAFTYYLFPFTFLELKDQFNLEKSLSFGTLPKICTFNQDGYKKKFLQSYAMTYLKEEIWSEKLVKNLDSFRRFLEVAAQSNGKIVNYLNISKDVGVDDKTVKNYFTILEDTLLGYFLESFHHSFRKRLKTAPKFYYFDLGIARTLSSTLGIIPLTGTSYYGELFEQFIISECFKLKFYYQSEYKLSYLMTEFGVEIDLIIERPGQPILLIEIKSKNNVVENDVHSLQKIGSEFGSYEAICLSQDPRQKKIKDVMIYPWALGLKYIFDIH
jgi:predicted AAA+ superfamily ATPase